MTAAIVIDLDAPGWLGPWLRQVHEAPIAVDMEHQPWLIGGGARGRFLSALEARCQAMRSIWLEHGLPNEQQALRTAAVLAMTANHSGQANKLWYEASRRDAQEPAMAVVAELRTLGKTLLLNLVDDDKGVVAAGLATLVNTINSNASVTVARRWAQEPDTSASSAIFTQAVDQAARARVQSIRALAGLAAADGRLAPEEDALIRQMAQVAGVATTDALAMLQDARAGAIDIDDIAGDFQDSQLAEQLIRLLQVTSFVDGEASIPELRFIERSAIALGLKQADVLRSQVATARDLEAILALGADLIADDLIDRMRERAERQIRSLVKRHAKAIAAEVRETGDLLRLSLESTRRSLSDEEHKRMMKQLRDLGRTVPALALFAAPGGSLLLPLLAKVLPFSLTPSSFEDEGL